MSITPIGAAGVQSAIAAASRKTGIDFDYLLGQAKVESGLNAQARASTSSATGLYQFIEQSWLGVVKKHGAEHGLGWAADSISGRGGRFAVSNGARQAILDLRTNPEVASLMAAEHAADNKATLEGALGRNATGTDLYMAHFLGLGGAKSFLSAMAANPDRQAANLFPAAARANRNVFFGANGQPRSLSDVYERFAAKLGDGAGATGSAAATEAVRPLALEPGMEVIMGNEAEGQDRTWLETTLANLNVVRASGQPALRTATVDPLRPTPATAKLAYLMLASLGA